MKISCISFRLFLILVSIIVGCSRDSNPASDQNDAFRYPLEVGNRWVYTREVSAFNFRPDTLDFGFPDTTAISNSTVEIVRRDTLPGEIFTFVLREIYRPGTGNRIFESESHYNNREDGLYFLAYVNSGFVIPKESSGSRILFAGKYFRSVREVISFLETGINRALLQADSLIIENPPLLVMPYPPADTTWSYRPAGNPFSIQKRIIGEKSVSVPAGNFDCFEVQWLVQISNEVEFFDYICDAGLVLRTITLKDLVVTSENSPEPIGMFDTREDSRLVEITLQDE